jgi:hypothetical protein
MCGPCSKYGGEKRYIQGFGGKKWWKDPDVDERIILRRIFRNWDVVVWTGSSWLRIGIGGGDPGVDGRIILRRIFRKWDVGVWTGSSWLRIGIGGGQL